MCFKQKYSRFSWFVMVTVAKTATLFQISMDAVTLNTMLSFMLCGDWLTRTVVTPLGAHMLRFS